MVEPIFAPGFGVGFQQHQIGIGALVTQSQFLNLSWFN